MSFLAKQAKKLPPDKRDSFTNVIESIKLCPLLLNLEDSLDLIGVDGVVAEHLRVFFSGPDMYVPKEGSIAYQMLKALHEAHPEPLIKADILKAIGFRPPPVTAFRPKNHFYGSWAAMKTLEFHHLADRESARSPKFFLTERGISLSTELFGGMNKGPVADTAWDGVTMLVATSELQCRFSIDVRDVIARTRIEWKEQQLPFGAIWFLRHSVVLDFVVTFANLGDINASFLARFAHCPFSKKIVLVTSGETERCAESKIKYFLDKEIRLVFTETAADAANYLSQVSLLLKDAKTLGSFDSVSRLCQNQKGGTTVGTVWKQQLRFVPGCGPNLAANLAARFETPHCLMKMLEPAVNEREVLREEISKRWGKAPGEQTIEALVKLFAIEGGI
jgi:hypothetical protein